MREGHLLTRIAWGGGGLLAAALLIVLTASVVLAQETFLDGKLRLGESLTIPAGETVDGDLYLLAGTVAMDGNVEGDLIVLGGQVLIDGSVSGDVLVLGGTVSMDGSVDGDLRTAAGQLTVSGPVGEDLAATAGQATLSSGGSVGEDLLVSAGTVSVAGSVDGSIEGAAGTYDRTGSVGGTEHVVVTPREEPEVVAGNVVFDAIRHFVVLILIGALGLWLLPGALRAAEGALRGRPLLAVGSGVATCIGYLVALIATLLLMVVLGVVFGLLRIDALVGIAVFAGILTLGIVTFLFVTAVGFVADIVVGLALGRFVAPRIVSSRWQELVLLVAGAAVVVIATSLPVVGGWIKLLVVLFGLGALALAALDAWRARREPTAAAQPTAQPTALGG